MGNSSQLLAGEGAHRAVTGTIKHHLCKWGLPKGLIEAGESAGVGFCHGWIRSRETDLWMHHPHQRHDMLLLPAITWDYSSLGELLSVPRRNHTHTHTHRHTNTHLFNTITPIVLSAATLPPLMITLLGSAGRFMMITSSRPLQRQKIDKSELRSSSWSRLFMRKQCVVYTRGSSVSGGDGERIVTRSLTQSVSPISISVEKK